MLGRKTLGLMLFSMGIGMLLVLFIPAGAFLLSILLTLLGFYLLIWC